jgi:hypothetical protein
MKRSNILRSIALTLAVAAISTTSLFASAKGTETILTDSEWEAIEESSRWERMMQPVESIVIESTLQNMLEMDLKAGRKTTFSLNAPFTADEQVGLVVIAADGDVVYTATGTYGDLQLFTINPNFCWDETYVVRLYSTQAVYETKVQVVYL